MINVAATTIFTLTATNSDGMTTGDDRYGRHRPEPVVDVGNRYAASDRPRAGRVVRGARHAAGFRRGPRSPLIDTNKPSSDLGGNASKVQFFVDDALASRSTAPTPSTWVFKGFITGVTPLACTACQGAQTA